MTPQREETDTGTEEDRTSEALEPARPQGDDDVPLLRVRIKLWAALVLMLVSFAAGFTIAAVARPAPTPQPIVEQQPAEQFPPAPPLTDEELQGSLPTDHPVVGGATPPGGGGNGSGGNGGGGTQGNSGSGSAP